MHPSSSTWALLPKHTQLTFGTSSVKNKRPRCKIIYHSLVGQALCNPYNTERGWQWRVVMQILALYLISILPHTLTHILSDINPTYTHTLARVIASIRHTHIITRMPLFSEGRQPVAVFLGAVRGAETQQKHQSRAGLLSKGVGRRHHVYFIQLASSRGLPWDNECRKGDGGGQNLTKDKIQPPPSPDQVHLISWASGCALNICLYAGARVYARTYISVHRMQT